MIKSEDRGTFVRVSDTRTGQWIDVKDGSLQMPFVSQTLEADEAQSLVALMIEAVEVANGRTIDYTPIPPAQEDE